MIRPVCESACVKAERDDCELSRAPDFELFVNLPVLLRADDDDAVRRKAREHPFNLQKDARLESSVITVKYVAVISVNERAAAWSPQKRRRRQPAIKKTCDTSYGPGLSRVRMNQIGAHADEQPVEFPDRP